MAFNEKEYQREYKRKNKKRILERDRIYREKYRPIKRANDARRRATKLKATPDWSEKELIKVVYSKAKWLESLTGLKYHVDHIVPLQGENVCGLHVWHNLQILEKSINLSKCNKV